MAMPSTFFPIKTGPRYKLGTKDTRFSQILSWILRQDNLASSMISACLSLLFKSLCPPNLWRARTVAVGNLMPIVKCRWCPFFTSVTPWRTKRPGPCPARTHTRSSPADSNVSNSSCPVPSVPWLTCRFESKDDLLRIIQKAWIHNEYHNSIHQQDGSFDGFKCYHGSNMLKCLLKLKRPKWLDH